MSEAQGRKQIQLAERRKRFGVIQLGKSNVTFVLQEVGESFLSGVTLNILSARQQRSHKLSTTLHLPQNSDSSGSSHWSHLMIRITAQTTSWILMRSWEHDNISDLIPGICAGFVHEDKGVEKRPLMRLFIVLRLQCCMKCSPFALWIGGLSLAWPNCTTLQSLLTDDYAKEKSHDCKNSNYSSLCCQGNKVLDGNFLFRLQHWPSLFLSAVLQQSCVFIFPPTPQFPAHFSCRQLSCHNEVFCVDSGWII